jgi:T5orf172 domain
MPCTFKDCNNRVPAQQKCWECGDSYCSNHLETCSRCKKWKLCPQCMAAHGPYCLQNLPNLGPLKLEKVIGEGHESVYVWYAKSEFESANLKGDCSWACKIGRTRGDVTARLIAQGSYTAFPGEPLVPLVIRTMDSQTLETLIHALLEYAGKRITNSRGTEWFRTNPKEIEAIYNALDQMANSIKAE